MHQDKASTNTMFRFNLLFSSETGRALIPLMRHHTHAHHWPFVSITHNKLIYTALGKKPGVNCAVPETWRLCRVFKVRVCGHLEDQVRRLNPGENVGFLS